MNRRPDAPDPLSPEERELAQRLLRLGPSDGPSPALDARILAAAHAAVATEQPRLRAQPRQRWPMWIGVAASLSLAVGIAWQLRPADTKMEAVQQEQDAAVVARAQVEPVSDSGGAQSADIQAEAAAAAPAAASAADSVAAPTMPAEVAPGAGTAADRAADAAAPAAMKPVPAPVAAPTPAPKADVANETAKRSRAEAAPASEQAAAATEARAIEPQRRIKPPPAERELKAAPAMAPPPPPPAPMGVMSAPAPVEAAPAANAGWASPADNLSSKRAAKAAAVAADAATLGKAEAYSERADVQTAPEPSSQRDASPALDRVEVTGSRIGNDASDESRLATGEWLDRIRGYRDAGETVRARESLQRFRRAHPHTRVPDDLRALLK